MSADNLTAPAGDGDVTVVPSSRTGEEAQSVAHALRTLTARFGLVLENMSDVIVQYDSAGRVLWASPSVRTSFGYDEDALVGTTFRLEHPDDDDAVGTDIIERMAAGEDVVDSHGRAICADGSVRWVVGRTRVVRTSTGELDYIVSTFRDVTGQTEGDAALAASEAHYRMLADNSSDVVLHTDSASGLVDWASPSAEAILGYRPDELVGRRVPDLMHPDDLAHVRGYVRDAMAADQHTGHVEARFRDKDGSWRWMSDSGRAVLADDGTVLGGIDSLRDVSAEHAMREELETLARSDALTGLPNRRDLLDRLGAVLGHEPRAGTSVAVLFLDVDHLKDLNDDHGHAAGDTVLVEVGHRIRRALRSEDVVGRFAGDEFVVLLPSLASPDDAWRVADAIHQQVARPIHTGGAALRVSVSIGLTIARTGDRPEDVLHRADVALYRAKDSGRARTEADVSDAPAKADDALPAPRESFTGEASTLVHED